MAGKTGKLNWVTIEKKVNYFFNGKLIGYDNSGFEELLNILRTRPVKTLVIEFKVIDGTGGNSLENNFPFKAQHKKLQKLSRELGFTIELKILN